jgi:hypothetical protein
MAKKKYNEMSYHEKLQYEIKEKEKKQRKAEQIEKQKIAQQRFCSVCSRPMNYKGDFCKSCNYKKNKLNEFLKKEGYYSINNREILWLKNYFNVNDIFDYLEKNPKNTRLCYGVSKSEKAEIRKKSLDNVRNDKYKNTQHEKIQKNNPDYIKELFDKYPIYDFICLEGEKFDPFIYCRCKRCGKELKFKYSKFKKTQNHGCEIGVKSSGEIVIEEYLKNNKIKYKTQRNTLKCINPKTKHQMPYDFELIEHKIIIEVQGNQHVEFIEYFHGTLENYEYQIWKDSIKKDYAILNGYTYIEIFYDEIKSGSYINKIQNAIYNN